MTDKNNPEVKEQNINFGQGLFSGQMQYVDYSKMDPKELRGNTLDEPICDTLWRDLKMILYKIHYVLIPRSKEEGSRQLRNWDLWGPLLICLALSLILGLNSRQGADVIFGTIFVIIWGGAIIISINAKLLGGHVSMFQSICVLGYCISPIVIAALVIVFLQWHITFLWRLGIAGLAFVWSSYSSLAFMSAMMNEEKKIISVYPIFLFYLFLSWFCIFV